MCTTFSARTRAQLSDCASRSLRLPSPCAPAATRSGGALGPHILPSSLSVATVCSLGTGRSSTGSLTASGSLRAALLLPALLIWALWALCVSGKRPQVCSFKIEFVGVNGWVPAYSAPRSRGS